MKRLGFLFGCQRSGTTALLDAFGSLGSVRTYQERGSLLTCSEGDGLRLRPLEQIRPILESDVQDLVVLKPLAESHRMIELIDFFPGSRALWIFRDYRDVIASTLRKWPSANPEETFALMLRSGSWSYFGSRECYSAPVVELIENARKSHPTLADACAVLWIARNSLFLDLPLDDRLQPMNYEALVTNHRYADRVFSHFGLSVAKEGWRALFHDRSIGGGQDLEISSTLRAMAEETYARLASANARAWQ